MASQLLCIVRAAFKTARISEASTLFRSLPRLVSQPVRFIKQKTGKSPTGKAPFEIDGNVKLRTRVYSCEDDKHFKYVTLFGFAQFAFWFHLGALNLAENRPPRPKESEVKVHDFWMQLTDTVDKYKDKIAIATMGIGLLVLFVTIVYPRRHIKFLDLAPGGERLLVTTYGYLGRTRIFAVPLKEVTFQQTRQHAKFQLNMKVKGHRFFFLLDQQKGKFLEPELFDNVIALKRKI